MRKLFFIFLLIALVGIGIYFNRNQQPNNELSVQEEVVVSSDVTNDPEKINTPNIGTSPKAEVIPPNKVETDAELLEKIDQLFIIGFRGFSYNTAPDIKRALTETNLGGVILFDYDTPTKKYSRNIQSEIQIKKLISDLQLHAKTPLFVAVDEEGGKVSRLKNVAGFNKTASPAYLGTQAAAVVRTVAKTLGTQLRSYGFNLDFAPVLDVNVNPSNPVIGGIDRSFSGDPAVVSEKGIAFMKGLLDADIVPVGKHFPGHGSSTADSHLGFVDITNTYKQYELEPFKVACVAGLPAVMIAHVYNKNVDSKYPATLSGAHIQILKKDTGCISQLIISDDMDMRAISSQYGRKEALTRALNAGVDVLIISNNVVGYDTEAFFKARTIVLDAVNNGSISRERIDKAYSAVTAFKLKYKIGL